MSLIEPTNETSRINKTPFNWPIVGFLILMIGIPAVPAIFLLALVVLGPSADGGMSSLINTVYFETPAAILVHGSAGILLFLTMPFQFSPALRSNNSKWHKIGGRIALTSGYILAASGVWMHHVLSPDTFGMRYMSLVIMSASICGAFSIALWYIINQNVRAHREWMVRAVAIILAAITPLFIAAILQILFGQLENIMATLSQFMYNYERLIGIGINLTIVELVFVREKLKGQTEQAIEVLV